MTTDDPRFVSTLIAPPSDPACSKQQPAHVQLGSWLLLLLLLLLFSISGRKSAYAKYALPLS
jgi:hypothetical protein